MSKYCKYYMRVFSLTLIPASVTDGMRLRYAWRCVGMEKIWSNNTRPKSWCHWYHTVTEFSQSMHTAPRGNGQGFGAVLVGISVMSCSHYSDPTPRFSDHQATAAPTYCNPRLKGYEIWSLIVTSMQHLIATINVTSTADSERKIAPKGWTY